MGAETSINVVERKPRANEHTFRKGDGRVSEIGKGRAGFACGGAAPRDKEIPEFESESRRAGSLEALPRRRSADSTPSLRRGGGGPDGRHCRKNEI